jgi:hypothetical protein
MNGGAAPEGAFRDGTAVDEACREVFGAPPAAVVRVDSRRGGHRAFRLEMADRRRLKWYECDSPARAREVVRASAALERHGVGVPAVVATWRHTVVAAWVEGVPLASLGSIRVAEGLAAFQGALHAASPGAPASRRFRHLAWLLARLRRTAAGHLTPPAIAHVEALFSACQPRGLRTRIVHPDLTPENVIVAPDGRLVVVDNEFLAIGTGFELDVVNTAHSVGSGEPADGYLARYASLFDTGTLGDRPAYWRACFLLKLAGKRFRDGRPDQGRLLVAEIVEGLGHRAQP